MMPLIITSTGEAGQAAEEGLRGSRKCVMFFAMFSFRFSVLALRVLPVFGILVLGLPMLGTLQGCVWKGEPPPSILVIMVENLGFNAFSCGDGAEFEAGSGLQAFCEESVRFTHAYTPSLMSQATIASVLTAKSPHEHGVRHNGAQALSAQEVTVAEAAASRGMRTAFFSGGPPVFRRSAINQGFDVFDDSFLVDYKRLYRPADEMVGMFLNWIQNDKPRTFFSVLYFADPQFIDVPTTNELGELRENSYHSQLDVVDEALGTLARELKRRKIWERTDIFLVGLNGNPAESRLRELPVTDLYSDRTRTVLMAKPASQKRETPFNWTIDSNVSLVDLGVTLFDLVGGPIPTTQLRRPAGPVSLRKVLSQPEPDWPEDREILSESAWGEWRGLTNTRVALRKGPFLYLFDERDRLYNTLTDSFESLPLPRREELPASTRAAMAKFLEELGYRPWHPVSALDFEKATLGRELWRSRAPDSETVSAFRKLAKQNPEDSELRGWRALFALRQQNWRELRAAAQPVGQGPIYTSPANPLWAFVAARNLGEKVAVPDVPCLTFLKSGSRRRVSRECERAGIRDLVDWANETLPEAERTRARDAFIRFYLQQTLEKRVAEYNEVAGRTWDTPLEVHSPTDDELLLALPELKKLRTIVLARIVPDRLTR